ncbi:unnamed protein product, partial [Hapterophycus canaliculatus]
SEAKVLGVVEDPQGPALILDGTIFHPQGGGQPSDQGTITYGSGTMAVSIVRDVGGVIHHFGSISGLSAAPSSPSPPRPEPGQRAFLALDGAKRLRHAALHSAGHAVDKAVMEAVGAGVFLPLKGYHFDDSPYVEYRGALPQGLEKDAFVDKLNTELDKLAAADVETIVEVIDERKGAFTTSSKEAGEGPTGGREAGFRRTRSGGIAAAAAARVGEEAAGARSKYGAATRIVTVAGLSCPCGGTHVRSTRELKGTRVTKVKAKKGTLRVSYTLAAPSASARSPQS